MCTTICTGLLYPFIKYIQFIHISDRPDRFRQRFSRRYARMLSEAFQTIPPALAAGSLPAAPFFRRSARREASTRRGKGRFFNSRRRSAQTLRLSACQKTSAKPNPPVFWWGSSRGGSPPRVESNALSVLPRRAFGERGEDFSAARRREGNGSFSLSKKSVDASTG